MKLTSLLILACVLWSGGADSRLPSATSKRFGIILDAGSTSTVMRIFSWPPKTKVNALPDVTMVHTKRFKPRLDAFSSRLVDIKNYLLNIVKAAKDLIPSNQHSETPIYLMMTAGARFLKGSVSFGLMKTVRDVLSQKALNPFIFKKYHARVLSGEEEGVFAWIAVNYLKDLLNSNRRGSTVGLLEMGGGSTQITFVPKVPIFANKYALDLMDRVYATYTHSYLNFGQQYMVYRIRQHVMKTCLAPELIDPCMLKGDQVIYSFGSHKALFLGGGDWKKCESIIRKFVTTAPDLRCSPKPCAIGGVYQPSVLKTTFYAIVGFAFQAQNLGAVEAGDRLNIAKMRENAKSFCSDTLQTRMRTHPNIRKHYLSMVCSMGLYIPMLLTEAFKFPVSTRNIIVTNKIKGTEISWALGAMLNEMQYLDILKRAQQSKPS